MKKKGQISAKTAKAIKELDQIPDIRLKIFFKMLLSAKDCGIDVFKKKGHFGLKPIGHSRPLRFQRFTKPVTDSSPRHLSAPLGGTVWPSEQF